MARSFAVEGRGVVEALFEFQREGATGVEAPDEPSTYEFELWARVFGERNTAETWTIAVTTGEGVTFWRKLLTFTLDGAVFAALVARSNTMGDEPPSR
jgi:hypothetical protein